MKHSIVPAIFVFLTAFSLNDAFPYPRDITNSPEMTDNATATERKTVQQIADNLPGMPGWPDLVPFHNLLPVCYTQDLYLVSGLELGPVVALGPQLKTKRSASNKKPLMKCMLP